MINQISTLPLPLARKVSKTNLQRERKTLQKSSHNLNCKLKVSNRMMILIQIWALQNPLHLIENQDLNWISIKYMEWQMHWTFSVYILTKVLLLRLSNIQMNTAVTQSTINLWHHYEIFLCMWQIVFLLAFRKYILMICFK